MKIGESLIWACEQLQKANVENPTLDSRVLLAHSLSCAQEHIIANPAYTLTRDQEKLFREYIDRRVRREPVSRITGKREFWGREFGVAAHVLDPRPDSETLIEAVLKDYYPNTGEQLEILDIGTGSGCLLVTLLCELKNATGVGTDISEDALKVARSNAENAGVSSRVIFMQQDFASIRNEGFDIVVSNPPYIKSGDITSLQPEVAQFDPNIALDGGKDGLSAYRIIIPQLKSILKSGGRAYFEIGHGQAEDVASIMTSNGFAEYELKKDLAGIDRCISVTKNQRM